jgi:hypothetical protein
VNKQNPIYGAAMKKAMNPGDGSGIPIGKISSPKYSKPKKSVKMTKVKGKAY